MNSVQKEAVDGAGVVVQNNAGKEIKRSILLQVLSYSLNSRQFA